MGKGKKTHGHSGPSLPGRGMSSYALSNHGPRHRNDEFSGGSDSVIETQSRHLHLSEGGASAWRGSKTKPHFGGRGAGGDSDEVEDDDADSEVGDVEAEEEGSGDEPVATRRALSVKLWMWEFGQNDPKRDSGSKLRRLGYASGLKLGRSFPGIVLSSEATIFVSPADLDLVQRYGIAGINCSWNRLDEIPFDKMGIGRNQRVLPLVYAANSVNYGRPYKLNTAEAIAVTLYIVGLKEDAMTLMEPFGYGAELFKINREALDAYSSCSSSAEVQRIHQASMSAVASRRADKEARAGRDTSGCTVTTDYLSGMDLPPSISDGEYDYEEDGAEEEEDNEEEREDRGGHNI